NTNFSPNCTELGTDSEAVRAGSARSMLLRDGDSHYLVTFRQDCNQLATTRSLKILGEGASHRVCPDNNVVRIKRAECEVQSIEAISAREFARRKRLRH